MDEPGSRPRVLISDRQPIQVDEGDLLALARETLLAEGLADVELSVSLVTREEMADLQRRYLGEPGPTDVLSFPLDDPGTRGGRPGRHPRGAAPDGEPRLLGDVVICPEVAAEQGGPESEVRLLLVHGILHLLGYDHEREEERAEMWALQDRYVGGSWRKAPTEASAEEG